MARKLKNGGFSTTSRRKGSKSRHSWTTKHRKALLCAFRYFDWGILTTARVLNKVFRIKSFTRDNISRCRRAMITDFTPAGRLLYNIVYDNTPFHSPSRPIQTLVERLERAARAVGAPVIWRQERSSNGFVGVPQHVPTEPNSFNSRPNNAAQNTVLSRSSNHFSQRVPILQTWVSASMVNGIEAIDLTCEEDIIKTENSNDSSTQSTNTSLQSNLIATALPVRYFFRAFNRESAGINTVDGFRAHQFLNPRRPIEPVPSLEDPELQWSLSDHLNRFKTGTPIISTTNSLIWAVSIALRFGNEDAKVALLDSNSILSYTQIYSGKEVMKKLKSAPDHLENAHFRYHGTAEWLVWGEIRRQSILRIISLSQVQNEVEKDSAVRKILRLEVLSGVSLHTARARLIEDRFCLAPSAVVGFVKILLLFGVTPLTSESLLEEIVFGLTQGWAIHVPEELIGEAVKLWIHHFVQQGGIMGDKEQQEKLPILTAAFLSGAQRGMKDI